jgi:hypothetical protein
MSSALLSHGDSEFDRVIAAFRDAGVPVEWVTPWESSA